MNQTQDSDPLKRVDGYEFLRLDEFIRERVKPAIKALDNEVQTLPRIGPDGQSECPFAAQLYSQKERKAAEVADLLTELRWKETTISEEIYRCLRNLDVVGRSISEIESELTKKQAEHVATRLQEQLSSARSDSERAKASIEEMARVLTYSEKIRHPDVPSVGVPAWSPEDRKKNDKRKSAPAASAPKPPSNPMPLPAPIPAGQSLGQNKGSVPLPPPIPIPPPMRRDSGKPLIPPPIPHPIGGTDMLLKPPKGAIHL